MNIEKHINNLQGLIDEMKFSEVEVICLDLLKFHEDSFIYYFLGMAQINLNKFETGVYYLKKSIFLNPQVSQTHLILAKLYKKFNMLELSKESFSSLMVLKNPQLANYIDYLEVLKLIKDEDEFSIVLNNALRDFPKSEVLLNLKK